MNKLKKWLQNATVKEKRSLALYAGTSLAYLRHVAHGRRLASSDLAGRIEKATQKMECKRLPYIRRSDISTVCKKCPYLKKCIKK